MVNRSRPVYVSSCPQNLSDLEVGDSTQAMRRRRCLLSSTYLSSPVFSGHQPMHILASAVLFPPLGLLWFWITSLASLPLYCSSCSPDLFCIWMIQHRVKNRLCCCRELLENTSSAIVSSVALGRITLSSRLSND